MTDGGRRWERGENKSRGTRRGGDEPKNVREPERVVGWLRCRVESNFLPHDLDSTAPYLNPVILTLLFICLPLFIFLYYFPSLPPIWSSFLFSSLLRRHSPPLPFLLTLPLPSTHAIILNSLLTTLVLSCSCPSLYPYHLSSSLPPPLPTNSSTHSYVYKRSLDTKGCVLRHSHREGCWQGPRHYQSKTSKSLGL